MTATGLLILAILAATIDLASFDESVPCIGLCLTKPSPPNCNDEKDDFFACVKCCGPDRTKTEFTKHEKCICRDDKGNIAKPNKPKISPELGKMDHSLACNDEKYSRSACKNCCGLDGYPIDYIKDERCKCSENKGNRPRPYKEKERLKIGGIKKIASLGSCFIDHVVSECDDKKDDFSACVKCCGPDRIKTEFIQHEKCICRDDKGNIAKPNKPKRSPESGKMDDFLACNDEKYSRFACKNCCGIDGYLFDFIKNESCTCKENKGNLVKPNKSNRGLH